MPRVLWVDYNLLRTDNQKLTWIRSPWWDGLFIWSWIPVTISLVFLASQPQWMPAGLADRALLSFFTVAVLLETGHNLSPIALAWLHGGFRRLMLGQPKKYTLLPGMVF